jgi:hypothetical protein
MYEEDFVKEETEDRTIDGKTFTFRHLTGGDSNEILDSYISVNEEGDVKVSAAKRNEEFVKRAVVNAPYECFGLDGEGNKTGAKKKWAEATPNERLFTLKKLRPGIWTQIVKVVLDMNEVGEEVSKK